MRPFNLLFSFQGKIDRTQYIIGNLILIGLILLYFLSVGWVTPTTPDILKLLSVAVVIGFLVVFITGYLALNIKRLRDIDWNVWLILLFFIPLIMNVMQILCLVVPGKEKISSV